MKLQEGFKEDLKYYSLKAIPYVIIVALCFILFRNCEDNTVAKEEVKALKEGYKKIEVEKKRLKKDSALLAEKLEKKSATIDSLKKVSVKTVDRWHKARSTGLISIVENACDTAKLKEIFINTVAVCDSMHEMDSAIIHQQELKEDVMSDIISNRDRTIMNREKELGLKDIELNIADKNLNKEKKKKWKWLVAGGLVGILGGIIATR